MKTKVMVLVLLLVALAGSLAVLDGRAEAEKDLWLTDLEAAKTVAVDLKRPLLVDFTGSDWCGWCIVLDKEVFSQDAFKTYAKESLVLVKIDFPQKSSLSAEAVAANRKLAEKYGIEGFPTILLLSADGKEIARTGYRPGGADVYVAHIKELLAK